MSQIRSSRFMRRPVRTMQRLQLECLEDRMMPSVTVTTTLDPTTPITGQVSLREAVNMVNAGQVADNTIIVPAGTYLNTQGALNVTHSLILQGAGANNTNLDGGGTDRVVFIDPAAAVNVQISGVTVRNGNTSGSGGGIDVQDQSGQSSVLTVQNSIITGNTAGSANTINYGGGIGVNNGDANVLNSQVTNNQVVGTNSFGGGIADNNGGTGNITVTDSVIAGNAAGSGGGGIAELFAGVGSLTVTGCTVSDNRLTASTFFGGGGIFAIENIGSASVSNTTIQGNTSLSEGGGYEEEGSSPASIVFSNDTISDNQSTQGNGGGIDFDFAKSNLIVQNSLLRGNSAAVAGGGINDSGSGNITLTDCTLDSNQAAGTGTGVGGGIDYSGGGAITLTDSTVSDNAATLGGGLLLSNSAATANLLNSTVSGNIAGTFGGGIEQSAGTLTVRDSQFTGNVAASRGGALDFNAGTLLTVSDSTFYNNRAGFSGGALAFNSGGGTSSLTNNTFVANTTVGDGGAIAISNGLLALVNDTINGNTAGGNGGGVSDEALGTPGFQNTIIAGNTAGNNGPDVFTGTGLSVTDNGGNFLGSLSGSTGFGAGTLTGNPLLGPLADNGGILAGTTGDQQGVQTEALLPDSPAIDTGVANGAPTSDERGFNRISPPDIGAFQFQNAALTVAVTPTTPTVAINGSDSFALTVTNTSNNPLPADNSTLTVALSTGLTTSGPLTFALGALAAGQSQTFTLAATATTLGTQTFTATLTSPDASPTTISSNASVNVVTTPPTSPPTPTPVGALTLFGFGFGPTGLDVFEIDGQGDVFAQAFGFGGISGSPQWIAADAVFRNLTLMNGAIVADLGGGNGQSFLMEVLNFSDSFVFQGLLNALFAGK